MEYDRVLVNSVGPPTSENFWKFALRSELAAEMGTVKPSQSSNAPLVVRFVMPFSFNHLVTAETVSGLGAAYARV